MHAITTTPSPALAASIDHRTGRWSAGGPVRPYRRVERPAHRPNYPARRLGALSGAVLSLVLVFQVFGAATAFFGASPALADTDPDTSAAVLASADTYVARAGDSLWSIADLHRGLVKRSAYIDALIELNGGTVILAGQAVLLP